MDNKQKLEELKTKVRKMDLPLKKSATNLVFGDGDSNAKVFCLGEGPGYWEDVKGIPFVGNAGKLLDNLLPLMGLSRRDVYISNVVMYRPPENRDPSQEEIDAFNPIIDEMIEIIKPKIILTLGRFSMAKFLPGVKISTVHGRVHNIQLGDKSLVVVPMYHPAAALRRGEIMNQIKADFSVLKNELEELLNKKEVIQTSFV